MLSLLGSIYGKIANVRNDLYTRGIFEMHDLGSRTISIGNITTGGTGKTPLVARVAEILAARGEKVCILTRGYGRENPKKRVLVSDGDQVLADASQAGDEPFELAQKLLGKAIVIADADRVAAADWAKRKFGITAFVLDDGFQHRKAKRDVDIVCIDATDSFGGAKMLPAGRLREPIGNLKRADIVVLTRSDMVDSISDLKFQISTLNPGAKIFTAKNRVVRVTDISEFYKEMPVVGLGIDQIAAIDSLAFCALGNPDSFYGLLGNVKLSVVATQSFRDHHAYTQADVQNIEGLAGNKNAEILITTAKDAVKLADLKFEMPVYVVEIEIELDDEAAFAALL